SYELGTNLENLTLLGSAAVNATGNSLRNVLVGNAADNILDGKRGADTLKGGAGNDTYHVDNVRDVISGESKAGTSGDRVVSSLTWSLAGDYVERLALTGDKDIDGTGNTLANAISGNGADNVLTGMAGNDSLSGGAGNDVLVGGAGADKLTGGSGWDRFTFNAASESSRSASDRIVDFDNSRDWIDLSSFDADSAAAGRQSFTFIGEAAFAADGTAQLRVEVQDGKLMLYGSTDADASAEFAVQVSGVDALTTNDMLL
ncbi:MAG TPA: M10 family metallopeptidase C-terminal domain-containing protein, partial [Ramlibacter sp.]